MAQRLSDNYVQDTDATNNTSRPSALEDSLSARLFDLYITPLREVDVESITDVPADDESGGQLTSEP